MLFNLFILILFTGIICGLFCIGGLICYTVDKMKEYLENKEYKGCTYSSHLMSEEEVLKYFDSLRR